MGLKLDCNMPIFPMKPDFDVNFKKGAALPKEITYTRNTAVVDPLGESFAANVPRLRDFGLTSDMYLAEREATNLVNTVNKQKYIEEAGGWTASGGAVVIVTQDQTVPEWNTESATRIQTSGGTTTTKYYLDVVTPSSTSVYYAMNVKVKNIGAVDLKVSNNIGSSTTVAPGKAMDVPIVTKGNGANFQLKFLSAVAGDSLDFLVFQPMMESGKRKPSTFVTGSRSRDWMYYYPVPKIRTPLTFTIVGAFCLPYWNYATPSDIDQNVFDLHVEYVLPLFNNNPKCIYSVEVGNYGEMCFNKIFYSKPGTPIWASIIYWLFYGLESFKPTVEPLPRWGMHYYVASQNKDGCRIYCQPNNWTILPPTPGGTNIVDNMVWAFDTEDPDRVYNTLLLSNKAALYMGCRNSSNEKILNGYVTPPKIYYGWGCSKISDAQTLIDSLKRQMVTNYAQDWDINTEASVVAGDLTLNATAGSKDSLSGLLPVIPGNLYTFSSNLHGNGAICSLVGVTANKTTILYDDIPASTLTSSIADWNFQSTIVTIPENVWFVRVKCSSASSGIFKFSKPYLKIN